MKKQFLAALVLALASTAASAVELLDLNDVAAKSGLTVRQVRMVLGAPTAFAEYRTSFRIAEQKVKGVLGEERYREVVKAYRNSDAKRIAAR